MSLVPHLPLNDSHTIPQLGFGVSGIAPEDTAAVVGQALEAGYRHVDTAQMYGNERGVGEAVRASGLDRREVFVTSKLDNSNHRPEDARRSFDATLAALGLDDVDLFLIHWPLPTLYSGDFISTWRVLEEFRRDGRARSIGVSNFQPAHLERLRAEADVVPSVNQVEVHPHFTNEAVRRYNQTHGVVTEAWSPLGRGEALGDATIERVAGEVGRTPAQVVLRWHIQRGDVVFPKTSTPSRMKENLNVFDFELGAEAMAEITGLDQGEEGRRGGHPDTFDYVPG